MAKLELERRAMTRASVNLEWFEDSIGRDAFYIPDTNKQLVCDDRGYVAHSLTKTPILIGWESEPSETPERDHCVDGGLRNFEEPFDKPSVSSLVEFGRLIYAALIESGCPLWASDESMLDHWFEGKVVTITTDDGVIVEGRAEREKRWAIVYKPKSKPRRSREEMRAVREERARKKQLRESAWRQLADIRSSADYREIVRQILGVAEGEEITADPVLTYYADRIARWRLTASPTTPETDRSQE